MKGLICSVFRSSMPDCSMSGISTQAKEVLLVPDPDANCDFGIPAIHSDLNGCLPHVVLRTRNVGNKEFLRAVPREFVSEGNSIHSCMGGCFIWSCDSRFPSDYPIPLHDRVEV